MARFCSLFSGSSGNSTYIGTSECGILIDAGYNAKQLTLALTDRLIAPETIKGIFITHEHTDHIGALRVFATKYNIPVFGTLGTLTSLVKTGHITSKMKSDVVADKGIEIGNMLVKSFATSHDSAQSCGYCVNISDGRKISVCTDTGIITAQTVDEITGSDLILLESNHDITMLKNGDYPYSLKQRILSSTGHLSNEDCSKAAKYFVNTGTSRLILGHLSRENNIPFLAFKTTNEALGSIGAVEGTDYILSVAKPNGSERTVIL